MSKNLKGMWLDGLPIDQPADTTRENRNVIFSKLYGSITNEDGFDKLSSLFSAYNFKGAITVDEEIAILFFSLDTKGIIIKADLKTNTYEIVKEDLFNFSTGLKGESKRNSKGEIIVSWVDDENPPRIINIDFVLASPGNYKGINSVLYKPSIALEPTIFTDIVADGGSLRSGAYQVGFQYENKDGAITNTSYITNPIPISGGGIPSNPSIFRSSASTAYLGVPPKTITDKAISIIFNNLDNNFDFIRIIVTAKIDNLVYSYKLDRLPFIGGELKTTVTKLSDVDIISQEEVIVRIANIKNAKAITQQNDDLYLGNLTKQFIDYNKYQQLANNVTLKYTSTLHSLAGGDKKDSGFTKYVENPSGFKHGEVYAFYLHVQFGDFTISPGFHIPGRLATGTNTDFVKDNGSTITQIEKDNFYKVSPTAKNFQVLDTCSYDTNTKTGTLGFWENESEIYPDTLDKNGVRIYPLNKVKHHKFPTLKFCKERIYTGETQYGGLTYDTLGIVADNVDINTSDNVIGWFISYAKQDLVDSIVVGNGLANFFGNKYDDSFLQLGIGANRSIHYEPDQGNSDIVVSTAQIIKMYCPDLLYSKPAITPSYIRNELIYKWKGPDDFKQRFKTGGGDAELFSIYEQYETFKTYNVPSNSVWKINTLAYLPANTDTNINGFAISNQHNEESIVIGLDKDIITFTDLPLSGNTDAFTYNSPEGYVSALYNTLFYSTINQYRTSLFTKFYEQQLVSTGYVFARDVKTSSTILGGDCKLGMHSVLSVGAIASSADALSYATDRIRSFYFYPVESTIQIGLRHEDPLLGITKFFPKSSTDTLVAESIKNADSHKIAYDDSFTAPNIIDGLTAFNPIEEFIERFPYRVARSLKGDRTVIKENNWRTFLPANEYEMPHNRGEIINLQGTREELLIHHRDSLFVTKSKTKLITSNAEVFLGAGDIFELPPVEVIAAGEGVAGTQHKYSCLLTKAGYFFYDHTQRIFYLYKTQGELQNISTGLITYLKNTYLVRGDNPQLYDGITVAYDNFYDRIIVTSSGKSVTNGGKTKTILGTTLSYSLVANSWVSFHDYTPQYLFNTRLNLYSISNNEVFRHNSKVTKSKYYDGAIKDMVLTLVSNENPLLPKQLVRLQWVSYHIDKDQVLINIPDTFYKYFAHNSYQATLEHDIVLFTDTETMFDSNTRRVRQHYHLNKLRDYVIDNTKSFVTRDNSPFIPDPLGITKSNYRKEKDSTITLTKRLVDKFLVVKMRYPNQKQLTFVLEDFTILSNPVTR